uniref:BTB domain-containing protein n=1 Tax=Glossina palpalis gambiensis TaxID=67801 RepID=A0A1B0BEH6_9MUSC
MDDEFKLCWKNFQDNIASGFQNLYDRGDLVDVTLACDGKLLHAHKFVLAICSPYFQEIFITNPCKHPINIYQKRLKQEGHEETNRTEVFLDLD